MWSLAGNLNPIVNAKDIVQSLVGEFVGYENGGSFFHTVGLEVLAYSLAGYQDLAYETFTRFLSGIIENRGWAQQLYWNTNTLVGGDPLNDCLLALWGFLRGGFGVTPTLTQGLLFTNTPFQALDGARYTFSPVENAVQPRINLWNTEGPPRRGLSLN